MWLHGSTMGVLVLLSPETSSKLQDSIFNDCSSEPGSPRYVYDKGPVESVDDDEMVYTGRSLFFNIFVGLFYTIAMLAALYFFMVAVKFIESGFMVALGCDAKRAFTIADNPLAGLVLGLVSTALLHSSSTITSITVTLVATQGLAHPPRGLHCHGGQYRHMCHMYCGGFWSNPNPFTLPASYGNCYEKLSVLMSNAKASSGNFASPVDAVVKPLANLLVHVDTQVILDITSGKKECTSDGSLLSGGAFKGSSMSDGQIGAIVVVIGFLMLAASLIWFVHMLAKVLLGPTKVLVSRMLAFNDYANILAGAVITFVVQSSTVVTCTLTPMAGLGVFTLELVYPLILGANLGTCGTALLASLVVGEKHAVVVALAHLWFNFFGIILFYPVHFTRRPIMSWARSVAYACASWVVVGVVFILSTYLVMPGVLIGLEQLCTANKAELPMLGYALSSLSAFLVAGVLFWYHGRGGRHRWHTFLELKYSEREERRRRDAIDGHAIGAINEI
ncbi:unnamed protein product [Phytophthora fragariaefolia]|uniref:Unnamed protein product n=1 Tax=Phytophthora fragariaefolia TaxID=1490495 RepID=A0A9W6YHM7_9STRA|nr:unnamed protein product [Phytophthora fragariaefolia]